MGFSVDFLGLQFDHLFLSNISSRLFSKVFFVSALLRDCSLCLDSWNGTWHLHLTQPYLLALGRVLIWVECQEIYIYILTAKIEACIKKTRRDPAFTNLNCDIEFPYWTINTPYSMGFDPPAQIDTSYEADALPPSHHGWTSLKLRMLLFENEKCDYKVI